MLAAMLSACGGGTAAQTTTAAPAAAGTSEAAATSAAAAELAELDFMYWGGAEEKAAVETVVENFNAEYAGRIHVTAQHVPDEYAQKLSSMIAGNDAPDIAYVPSGSCVPYAQDGTILFVEDALGDDKSFLEGVLLNDQWKVGGKTAFFSTAHETMMITYNRDIFDELGVAYPPTNYDDALTWEQFADLCRTLTVDRNGNNANSSDFDPANVKSYGFSMTFAVSNWYPMLRSLGGDILLPDDSNTALDSPEMIDLMSKLQDLLVKEHVAPSMTDVSSNPDPVELMLTGQVAMIIDGNWSFIDYAAEEFNVGCTFLPDMGNKPYTISAPGVTAMFKTTKYPDAALEFYKYSLDAEKGATALYQNGLWQPIYKEYYTDSDKVAFWAQTGSRPDEFVSVVVEPIEKNVCLLPTQFITDYSQIGNVLNPAVESILRGEADPAAAMREVQQTVNSSGFYKGRFDQ
ncbi:MAG: extracellular solute-binding protein [Clostridiales bacterium]|nr:extracellular solute-binding protein [Clostridiales bacterium]